MSTSTMIATVSGSFHRHMREIEIAVHSLTRLGVRVVSPSDPRVVDARGEFLFVASDRVRSVRLVQDRHLDSIAASDFLWLVCPDGYVGQSASMEVGFAAAKRVPIFSTAPPFDLTLRHYVQVVPTIESLVERGCRKRSAKPQTFLIDPHASIETAHAVLERMERAFDLSPTLIDDAAGERIYADVSTLASTWPTRR
jgi:hypothetical protein